MNAAVVALAVLTLNAAGPRRVHQGWQTRRAALADGLKAEAPDAAAFQEVWRPEDTDALALAAAHAHRVHDPALGLAITSRLRVTDFASLDLGAGGVLRAGLDIGGASVDVYSARLEPASPARRLGRLLALAEFIRAQSKKRAFVLLGDLSSSSDEKEIELFTDFLGARDLCISHGDEMCGRTLEDRRVDYMLIPYSSRPPRETAHAAFGGTRVEDDEIRPLSAHFGLTARLDARWLKLRLAEDPDGRTEALTRAADFFDAARAESQARARDAGWIPWRGVWRTLVIREETARLAADAERARTLLARAAPRAAPALE